MRSSLCISIYMYKLTTNERHKYNYIEGRGDFDTGIEMKNNPNSSSVCFLSFSEADDEPKRKPIDPAFTRHTHTLEMMECILFCFAFLHLLTTTSDREKDFEKEYVHIRQMMSTYGSKAEEEEENQRREKEKDDLQWSCLSLSALDAPLLTLAFSSWVCSQRSDEEKEMKWKRHTHTHTQREKGHSMGSRGSTATNNIGIGWSAG